MTTHVKHGSSSGGGAGATNRFRSEPPAIDLGEDVVTVLSISPYREDHEVLRRVLQGRNWKIQEASTLSGGSQRLRRSAAPLVVCERDSTPGMWHELVNQISAMPKPSRLIVTSRLADERFWAEALNLGAFDVLAKPLEAKEVIRAVSLGWLQWKLQDGGCAPAGRSSGRPTARSRTCGGQVA